MGAIGVCADVTLSVTLRSFLRWPRPWKAGPAVCLESNLYQQALSLPVNLEPSIHFTRPIATMSEQWGKNGAAWRVCFQSASSSSHVGAMLWKCVTSPCNTSRDQGGLVMIASAAP